MLHRLHLDPGDRRVTRRLLGPRRRLLLQDRDPAVLVDGELPQVAGLPGLPDLVEQVVPGGGQLVVEVDLVLREVVVSPVLLLDGAVEVVPPVGHHARCQCLPAGARGVVYHPDDVGVPLAGEGVEGHHGGGGDVGARLKLEHPGDGLGLAFHPSALRPGWSEHLRWTGQLYIPLHSSLSGLVHILL